MKVIESEVGDWVTAEWDVVCPKCGSEDWLYNYYDENDFECVCEDCDETF